MQEFAGLFVDFLKWLARRPRLKVRIMRDDVLQEAGVLRFEVENRSTSVTSLEPEIRCKYYYVSKGRMIKKGRNRYFVKQSDRRLEPFRPIILEATPDRRPQHYFVAWFRTYTFCPASGVRTKVRLRNALLEPIGAFRSAIEVVGFRYFGKLRADPHSTIDDLERLRRSQGPHE